ncbi:hypothetical protein ND861_08560 [Leptospira sp. 2 VSF19]|uniref:Glycosyltransferase RgtA/B/C/D-like domain-containing protein n=1 Tax=Leptospira soteropolitanensis TaxID=2950025 RepID=A0AAW5VJB0_9LEPT|nr:hypothetical protein [Leptospira soteropolitanensis]MCW7500431.1 hypothetical protein [Leptospira soteropolitanensis]MCW7526390.1 hypothetical protein [Leptospira soteropolitanensis]MCW7530401.1 hypothetical protein [Leptospira soteropolitanensis]
MANIKAFTEEGGLISSREPLAIWFVVAWKKLFGMNYIPSFLVLAGLFYSLFLHLFMLLLRSEEWKRNHYLLVYLAAFLPFSYGFPTSYFTETLCLVFLLLVFLTFRLEKMTDLLIFPTFTILAFFSSFIMFYLGFTFFVILTGIRGSRKAAQKTSVFYKKKNLPFLFLLGYLGFFVLSLIYFSYTDFFGPNSIGFLFKTWYTSALLILLPLVVLGIGHVLLNTEKELNTITASVVIVVSIAVSIYFIFKNLNASDKEPWEIQSKNLTKAFGQALILKSDPIYLPKEFSFAFYFQTGTKTKYMREETVSDKSFLYVEGIWNQDIQLVQKSGLFRRNQRSFAIVPISEHDVLIQRVTSEKIKNEKSLNFITKKVDEAWLSTPAKSPFDLYTAGLQKKFGYLTFY